MRDFLRASDYLRLLLHVLEGDPVAITGVSLLVGMVVVICLIWWKIAPICGVRMKSGRSVASGEETLNTEDIRSESW